MTRFVIGVGINSVPGDYIDLKLQEEFQGSEVNPIVEAPYENDETLASLYQRSVHYAERMRHDAREPAHFFVGVASGLVKVGILKTNRRCLARVEVASVVNPKGHALRSTCLNGADVQWQVCNKKCAEESCMEPVDSLMALLREYAKAATAQK